MNDLLRRSGTHLGELLERGGRDGADEAVDRLAALDSQGLRIKTESAGSSAKLYRRGRTARQSFASVARAGCVDKPKLADVACPRSSPYVRKSSRSSLRGTHTSTLEKPERKRLYVRRQPEARLCRISRRQEPFLPERRDKLD